MDQVNTSRPIAMLSAEERRAVLEQRLREKTSRAKTFPVSFAQKRLWFLDQLQPGSAIYNMPVALRLSAPVNVGILERCLNEIVRRHEVLRTTFGTVDGRPVQVVAPQLQLGVAVVDLRQLGPTEREAEAQRLAAIEAQRPFDLARGPLLRATLLQLAEADAVLLLSMHHIVSDGWSLGVLYRELATLYQSYQLGQPSPLAELSIQYADFAVWQREWLQGDVLAEQLGYWQEQLRGAPAVLELPTDRPRPSVQTFRGAVETFVVPRGVATQLGRLVQREGATLFMGLLAAFGVLLHRYTGQTDLVVGSPIANRTRAELEGLIGFFVNTLALRLDLGGEPTFRELLGRVREVTLGAYAHQDLPFEKLVEDLQPERDLSRNPLFQVMCVLQNAPALGRTANASTDSSSAEPPQVDTGTARLDLTLTLGELPDGRLAGAIEYNTDLFDAATMRRLVEHFQTLLSGIAAQPDARVSALPLLPADEYRRLVLEWNATTAPYPADRCVHELIEEQAARTPEAVAVSATGEQRTYAELCRAANQLAHYLRA